MTERDPFKGRVRYYARIECADCGTQDEQNAVYRPVLRFVVLGWRKWGGLWRCPNCAKGATDGE